jgi:YD repeat-containing protein
LGRETNYRYGLRDTTFTFADKITNALDHQTDFKYDLSTGNLLWKKENGIYTYFVYDTFGRLIKEIQPFDSNELPTKSYNYSFDGTAPESIKISQRTTANKTFDTYFYYDGLGNFIQFKKPSDGGQQIVKNLVYDGMGRVSAESNPYFASFSTGLTTQNSDFMNYTYDALSRVISVRNPDGNISSVRFDHWNITAYDENNHRKMYSTDAYGRIVNVLGGFYDN